MFRTYLCDGKYVYKSKSFYIPSVQYAVEGKKMMTTVTTATATTTASTTTSTVVAASHAAVFGAIGVVILIGLLIAKELLSASENKKAQLLGRYTSIAINPLMVAFLLIVGVKVLVIL
jgi:hypothetical protein